MMSLETAAEFASMLAGSGSQAARGPAEAAGLTPREKELITMVAKGRTDAQIAEELFISIRTVRSHLDRIRDKSGSRRRADLTRLALRAGWSNRRPLSARVRLQGYFTPGRTVRQRGKPPAARDRPRAEA